MCRGNLRANTCLSPWHDRVGKPDYIDAFFKHSVGKPVGERGIAEHDRYDGVFSGQDIEPGLGDPCAEKPGIGLQTVAKLGVRRQ